MSERTENRSSGQSPASKSERRLAAKLAAQKAAEAKRRRQSMLGALAGLAVVGVIVGAFVVFGGDDEPADQAMTSSPSASADAPGAAAPQLPPNTDPALGTKPVVAKGSGELTKLTVTPLVKGTGPATKAGQQLTVNYVGVFYASGEEFDASWKTGQPFTFQVGAGRVIPGWDQGLVGVNVGSRVQLDIPAELAYRDGSNGGPAGPLRFVVDVLAAQ
ncbi:peptidylprolyl isomerase [Micromonospora echinospora]|uniref:Peptidyl-prolyl cis-trans isomerase n=1 Tax=Micromonospora echinospora TaxID=1877 RepID=A0A1C4VSI7_MICEC|nr:FKBP-type peptidyl-prolyl cis-trans isomerase [Micromonospora echinospora]OZV76500.1 peptidylprolyl isomerase [Micromonospora echinospora]SCE86930.1 peptidylprolyl isomerase [Micromonospora echinospora]